jgi:hypothetical protein
VLQAASRTIVIRKFVIRNIVIGNFVIGNFVIRNFFIRKFFIRNFGIRNFVIRNFVIRNLVPVPHPNYRLDDPTFERKASSKDLPEDYTPGEDVTFLRIRASLHTEKAIQMLAFK